MCHFSPLDLANLKSDSVTLFRTKKKVYHTLTSKSQVLRLKSSIQYCLGTAKSVLHSHWFGNWKLHGCNESSLHSQTSTRDGQSWAATFAAQLAAAAAALDKLRVFRVSVIRNTNFSLRSALSNSTIKATSLLPRQRRLHRHHRASARRWWWWRASYISVFL